ncbi:MAG: hypothetical protein C4523_17335 [Myxococcales bacterium]|nr:MAG: hypothetical protein C4523_17335 [Myxococcales bacterium]
MNRPPGLGRALAALLVAAAAVLAYFNAAPPIALYDDALFVPNHFGLDFGSIVRLFTEDSWISAGHPMGVYRPLTLFTFAVDQAAFGPNVSGFHITNILLHVGACLLLYGLLCSLLRTRPLKDGGDEPLSAATFAAAVVAACVFAVHPIHTEAVDSIFNRSEILAAIGVLAGLWSLAAWSERKPRRAWFGAAACYFLALLCRESAVSFPVLAGLLLWLLDRGQRRRGLAKRLLPVAWLALPLAIYFAMRHAALSAPPADIGPLLSEEPPGDLGSRLLFTLASLREYLRMIVWPHPLRVSYENFQAIGNVGIGIHLAVLALAVWARRRAPGLTFGIAFFYLALLPSTRLLTSPHFSVSVAGHELFRPGSGLNKVAERYAYMPSAGLAAPLAFGLAALGRYFSASPSRSRRKIGVLSIMIVGLGSALLLTPLTLSRNVQWRNEVDLWEAEVMADPTNPDAWRLVIIPYLNVGRNEQAAAICDIVAPKYRVSPLFHHNCGLAYVRVRRFTDAEAAYKRALDGGLTFAHVNLAVLYRKMGRERDSEAESRLAVEAETDPAVRHFRRGQMLKLLHRHRWAEARNEFEQALKLQPNFTDAAELLKELDGVENPRP